MKKLRLLLLMALGLSACPKEDQDSSPPDDTETDADADGDADSDTDSDADADGDADSDSDTDTDSDADVDESLWTHCPASSAWVGDKSWEGRVEAGATAIYCGAFNEERTLEQELEAKAQLRIVAGSYPLPTTEGFFDLGLPLCTLRADGPGPEIGEPGVTQVSITPAGDTAFTWIDGSQPTLEGDAHFDLGHLLILSGKKGATPAPLLLDGAGAGANFTLAADGVSPSDLSFIRFSTCDDPTWAPQTHHLLFEGGEIWLEVEVGEAGFSTASGRFSRAWGTLFGEAFDLHDYFQLVYHPEPHHLVRHFAVIFDTPIGEACALRIEEVDPLEGGITAVVSTARCDLSPIELLEVSEESFED